MKRAQKIQKLNAVLQKSLIIFFLSFLFVSHLYANNLGVYGEVFPVTETDMLDFIHQKLNLLKESGKLDQLQKDFQARVIAHTLRPAPVSGITKTVQVRTFFYDPTLIVQQNIYDANGHVVIPMGTKVNPLDHMQFNEVLFFIDADDQNQVNWVMKARLSISESKTSKIILVNGNILDAAKKLGRIYFDQSGKITEKLGIQHVPAMVIQHGKELEIKEVVIQ